jgi:hypothetical protein
MPVMLYELEMDLQQRKIKKKRRRRRSVYDITPKESN